MILDKVTSQKEANHLKWQSQIPFVTISSPCDPTANYCDINILDSEDEIVERGKQYFSICNLGKANAYEIKIYFCSTSDFIESNIFHRHYIPYLQPLICHDPVYNSKENYIDPLYSNREFIYSNYNVNPENKEISDSKFEICNCLSNCACSVSNNDERIFYARIEY